MGHERILIVEDETIAGMDIRQMVQELGYDPIGLIGSGEDAVAFALAHHPDVVLMDILLKGPMSGILAAEAIRSQSGCAVIYVTAQSERLMLDLAEFAQKRIAVLMKPVDEQELHSAIENALHQPRMEEPLGEPASRVRESEEPLGEWPPRISELAG